jgi:glycosyltransferase involved in cell wall biosynthesis
LSESDAAADALRRRLRLAVDARDLADDRRGIGTYARALLSRFAQRDDIALTLLVRHPFPALALPALRAAIGASGSRPIRCAGRVPHDADVVWHPWNGTFFESLRPAVATIHDLIPFALPAAGDKRRVSQQTPIRRTAASARAIVCDSASTAWDVARYLDVAPHRLHEVPLGVDPAFTPGDLAALPAALRGRRYVLYVGAHDPHKNVTTLIEAFRRAFPAGDVALAFTRPNPLAPEAVVCENASPAKLVALYRGAALVAVPSLYEGFGLPVVEALACGAPVLAARATALPETGGDVAAYVDEPRDAGAWERALCELVADAVFRATTLRRGPAHAALFSWDRCAARTLAVLRTAAVPAIP